MTRFIYLHGFCSSGNSDKVAVMKSQPGWLVEAPNLPDRPLQAIPFLEAYLQETEWQYPQDNLVLIGTSLGAYYADHFSRKLGFSCVLINPLVDVDDMKRYLGRNRNFHTGIEFEFSEDDLASLRSLRFDPAIRTATLVLLDEGDELLDYNKAIGKYAGRSRIERYPGGSHRFDHLGQCLELIEQLANTMAG